MMSIITDVSVILEISECIW